MSGSRKPALSACVAYHAVFVNDGASACFRGARKIMRVLLAFLDCSAQDHRSSPASLRRGLHAQANACRVNVSSWIPDVRSGLHISHATNARYCGQAHKPLHLSLCFKPQKHYKSGASTGHLFIKCFRIPVSSVLPN